MSGLLAYGASVVVSTDIRRHTQTYTGIHILTQAYARERDLQRKERGRERKRERERERVCV